MFVSKLVEAEIKLVCVEWVWNQLWCSLIPLPLGEQKFKSLPRRWFPCVFSVAYNRWLITSRQIKQCEFSWHSKINNIKKEKQRELWAWSNICGFINMMLALLQLGSLFEVELENKKLKWGHNFSHISLSCG